MRRNAGKRCWCSALLLHCISSIVHSEGQISGDHFCYLCIRFGDRIRALHAKKTYGPDRIPVPCHRNQRLFRVRIIVCHRIISVIFLDKIPVKESLLHRFTERFPLILLILRPGRGHHLLLITDTKQLPARLRRRIRQLLRPVRKFPDRRIFLQNNLPIPIRKNLQRLRFPYLQRPPYLLRNHHPPEIIPLCQVGAKKFYKLSEKPLISMALGFPDGATMRLRGFDRLCYFRSKFDRFAPK